MMIIAPHNIDQKKLDKTIAEMATLGTPKIKAYYNGEAWEAVEGSHRIAAAHKIGVIPEIIEVGLEDEIDHDFEDVEGKKVLDVLEYLSASGPHYNFD